MNTIPLIDIEEAERVLETPFSPTDYDIKRSQIKRQVIFNHNDTTSIIKSALSTTPQMTKDIAKATGLATNTIGRHLNALEKEGVVEFIQEGMRMQFAKSWRLVG